ncbi:MAG: interleukin-like EMT inducer domain-containing protein [Caldilineaceae bacterium]
MKQVPLSKPQPFQWHGWVLLLYSVLACALTWPLVRHFTTHVPGDGIDDPSLAWNLWWIKARLVEQLNLDIFHVDWMFHPITINLGFYTLTPLNGLISTPLQLASTLIIASNLMLLSSFVLGGYGAFLLVRELLQEWKQRTEDRRQRLLAPRPSPLAPCLAGLIYAFASSKLFYAGLGQFNIASSQWIPFCVLYLWRMGRSTSVRSGLRNALLAGLFLTFQAWAELTYASFLLIFTALYFLWLLVPTLGVGMQDRRSASFVVSERTQSVQTAFPRPAWERAISGLWSLAPSFVLLGLTFLLGIAPFLWAMLPDLRREGDFFASGGGFADQYSADLMGYLFPTRLHPLFGQWVASLPFPNDKGQQIYVGYSALALAVVGVVTLLRRPAIRVRLIGWFWLLMTFFFWLLTLGPHLRWAGHDLPIPGPFALISKLPFFSGNRYPSRYSVMLMLCVAVLTGYGVRSAEWGVRNTRWRSGFSMGLVVILGAVFLFEQASFPLPINDSRVPVIYEKLAAQPGDFTVLELPTGWRNGARVLGKSDKLIMMQQWYQAVHGKRRLGGNTSRTPMYKFQYFTDAPLLGDLIALMNADGDHPYLTPVVNDQLNQMIERDRPLAGQVLDFLGVQYVTVQVEKSPPALLRFIDAALPLTLVDEWRGPDWTGAPSTIRLYQVQMNQAPSTWEINLAENTSNLYLGEGWSTLGAANGARYATRSQADLLLNVPTSGGKLALQIFGPATTVDFTLNGHPLGARPVPETSNGWVELTIPPGAADQPVDRLELNFHGPVSAVATLLSPPDKRGWPIGSTGTFLPASTSLLARSAGNDVGDFAQIWINGRNVALSGGEPAYNLAALDAQGKLLDNTMFDTHNSAQASTDMAHWLLRWPNGTIIAGAVADSASNRVGEGVVLGEDAVNALAKLGVKGDLRGKLRWSHAFIGVVGAPPGSAVEQMDLLHPATVFVGAPVDGAVVSGGVGRVRFQEIR